MLLLVTLLAPSAEACPTEVATALQSLTVAKTERVEAYHRFHETDWNYKMATEDRDQVLAQRSDALDELRDSRHELKDAKVAVRNLKDLYPPDQMICDL